MIFTRIKRGAVRTSILINHKLVTLKQLQVLPALRKLVPLSLMVPLVIVPGTPAIAADQPGTLLEDSEPSSTFPLNGAGGHNLAFTVHVTDPNLQPIASFVAPVADSLAEISVGKSYAVVAAEEAAAVEAARRAEEEARKQAEAAAAAKKAVIRPAAVIGPVDYDALFQKYFGAEWKIAKAICMAESGLNPLAMSRTNDYGVCQINQVHRRRVGGDLTRLFDPETNIRVAADIRRDNGGFHPWTVYKKGIYKKYLAN